VLDHRLPSIPWQVASSCVGERYNRSGKRLLLRVDDKTVCFVPLQWTDTVASDPEVAMRQGFALFRVSDLLGLANGYLATLK
jgi:hypothetical protein